MSLMSRPVVQPSDERSLAFTLRSFAITHVPARFYFALQLAAPLAVQLWASDWKRASLSMTLLSAFGVWALCEQRIDRARGGFMSDPAPGWGVRAGRALAGIVATTLGVGLALELFVRIMSVMFRCPACAG